MADNLRLNANRPGTGRLGPLAPSNAPEQAAEAQPAAGASVVKKAKTDTLRLSSEAAGATGPLDPTKLNDMAKAVGAVQGERQQVSDFQARINSMVPGGVRFETKDGASWTSGEMRNLLEVVEGMSPGDRQALSGLNFVRTGQLDTAAGGDAAVSKHFGKELGDVAGQSAMASAQTGTSESTGFMAQVRNFALHSAEVLEGIPVLRFIGKSLKAMFGQEAPERAIVLGNSGSLVSKNVWAHEIGHQVQMVNRGWNPEKIAEFGKLSGWTENYADGKAYAADGVDNRTGEKLLFDEQVLKAARSDNFVSKYAMTSPTEDFAESYQAFLSDPKKLMQVAPEKFLYINAQSQRYGASEVKGFAQQAGQDLEAVATELMLNSGLKQQTLDAILGVNGLSADKGALVSEAASQLASGDALSQAWAKIAVEAKDPASASRLLSNPEAALGDIWGKLDADEQALFKDGAFMQARVAELQGGTASFRSSADATQTEAHRRAIGDLVGGLLKDPAFGQALGANPAQALQASGLGARLAPEVAEAFATNPEAARKLTEELSRLMANAGAEERTRFAQNLDRALVQLGPEHFSAFAMALNNKAKPDLAASMLRQVLETGNAVYQGGGDPPIA
ncbi:MAG TPA: hypothetical protein V6D00_05155 [Pantanalinema sp.]